MAEASWPLWVALKLQGNFNFKGVSDSKAYQFNLLEPWPASTHSEFFPPPQFDLDY